MRVPVSLKMRKLRFKIVCLFMLSQYRFEFEKLKLSIFFKIVHFKKLISDICMCESLVEEKFRIFSCKKITEFLGDLKFWLGK